MRLIFGSLFFFSSAMEHYGGRRQAGKTPLILPSSLPNKEKKKERMIENLRGDFERKEITSTYPHPHTLSLHSTPLHSTLLTAHTPKKKKKRKEG